MDLRPGDAVSAEDLFATAHSIEDYAVDDFDQTLTNKKGILKNLVQLQDEREKIMTARFEEEIGKILSEHPELKNRKDKDGQDKPLRVLSTMGSYHTSLLHKFRAQGIDVERAFPEMPYVYDFSVQAEREFVFGKEPSRDLLAKAYLENILNASLQTIMVDNVNSNDKKALYLRAVASHFETSDIEAIHGLFVRDQLTVELIDMKLYTKGLDPLPRNNEELESRLAQQKEAEEAKKAKVKAEYRQRRQLQGKPV
jgi:hypothetical protein